MDRRAEILNFLEIKTWERLRSAVEPYDCRVSEKVRVADALNINGSGLSNEDFNYALRSHFDFVVSRANKSLFAVEFDGLNHSENSEVIERDNRKNRICTKLGMPFLRIDKEALTTEVCGFQILGWLCEQWFRWEQICDLQQQGFLPLEEPFDPRDFAEIADGQITFPHDPMDAILKEFGSLHERSISRPAVPLIIRWEDKKINRAKSVTIAEVHPGTGTHGFIVGAGWSRTFDFAPVSDTDVAAILSCKSCLDRFRRFEQDQTEPTGTKALKSLIDRWQIPGCSFDYESIDDYSLRFTASPELPSLRGNTR